MKFMYARDALKYLIKKYDIKEIYIPYYLCDVIRHSVFEVGCKPLFYHINDNFMPHIEFPKDAFILYPNYFGICDKNVRKLIKIYPRLIVDNAHAYYAQPSGFASFDSERKFLSVSSGANLYIGDEKKLLILDYERRKKFNFYHKLLHDKNLLQIDIEDDCIPFCYPYLAKSIEEADNLVKTITQKGLTVYRYWNALPQNYNEYKFYSRLVPIPL